MIHKPVSLSLDQQSFYNVSGIVLDAGILLLFLSKGIIFI